MSREYVSPWQKGVSVFCLQRQKGNHQLTCVNLMFMTVLECILLNAVPVPLSTYDTRDLLTPCLNMPRCHEHFHTCHQSLAQRLLSVDSPNTRSRTTLKFWSATMLGAAARNFGPVHKFELPTVIADSVPRATRVFSLASVGHVTGHMVSHMVPIARCRPPYWKIFTVNNLATVF